MSRQLRVAFAGGGTGGHLYPALNLARVFEAHWDCRLLFFGTQRGIEARKLPALGYDLEILPVRGFQRSLNLQNLMFPLRLWQSLRRSKRKLKEFRPHLVIGTGGYVMGPVLKNSTKMAIPTFIQEQNSYPGVTTRLLAAKADMVFLAYDEALAHLGEGVSWIHSGNPIFKRQDKPDRKAAREKFGLTMDGPVVLVFGGSQGALSINNAVRDILHEQRVGGEIQILWQTGDGQFETIKRRAEESGLRKNVKIVPYIDDMWSAYSAADFAVCRAGAMSLSELMAAGLPAILVPLKSAAADHQTKNARALQQKECAMLVEDNPQLAQNLAKAIKTLGQDKALREKMSRSLLAMAQPDAAEKIVDKMVEVMKQKQRWPLENES